MTNSTQAQLQELNLRRIARNSALKASYAFTDQELAGNLDPRLEALALDALEARDLREYVAKINRGEARQPRPYDPEAFKASLRDTAEKSLTQAADRLADALPDEREDPRAVQARLGRQQGIVGF